ncbi:MAG TPA: hypothetical protein VI688_07680 [Anaerolineales bacterium]|nr:hypothetical protein [Anaerolineales bacterium]HLE74109.1 hypothetical protein [Anaerolineales bacterium]
MEAKAKRGPRQLKKLDGVIEAAHFNPDGKLAWVRAYERRGPTWSDVVLLDRDALVQRLRQGKRFYVGSRREFWASEFDLTLPVRLVENYRSAVLVTGRGGSQADRLAGIPVV